MRRELASHSVMKLAALEGVNGKLGRALLLDFAETLIALGFVVGGAIEFAQGEEGERCTYALKSLSDEAVFPITQDLGPGSQSCSLDSDGLARACAAAQRSIANGADFVILSKFGKEEANGRGLVDAFGAALAAGIPTITTVSPAYVAAWRIFSGDLSQSLRPDAEALDAWRSAHSVCVTRGRFSPSHD